jgi:hypothetical protein
MTAASALAQIDTATLSVNVSTAARLSLSSSSLSFPDADPDTVPLIPGTPGTLSITAKARATRGATVTLTMQASDDLRSGVNTIPASTISWTVSGPGFVNGTVSRTTPRTVGSWTGSGVRTGDQSFAFVNSWTYPTGTYSLSLLYTLTSP